MGRQLTCSDVQPHANGLSPVESQLLVHLHEVIMATDLNRPVADAGDTQNDRLAALVDGDVAFAALHLPRRGVLLRRGLLLEETQVRCR
eukprot:scaffold1896_cov262-Pinguiococcus_pyrenoidosus.AAC.6